MESNTKKKRDRSRNKIKKEEITTFKKLSTAKEESQIQYNSYQLHKSEVTILKQSISLDNTNSKAIFSFFQYLAKYKPKELIAKKFLYLICSLEERKSINQLFMFTREEIKDYKKELISFFETIKSTNQSDETSWKHNFSNAMNSLIELPIPKDLLNYPLNMNNENHFYLSLINYIQTQNELMIAHYQFASKGLYHK